LSRVLDRLTNLWRALFVGGGSLRDELGAWAAKRRHLEFFDERLDTAH
jgi:hypothetical protein